MKDISPRWKAAFAVAAVAILIASVLLAPVNQGAAIVEPAVPTEGRVVDLDFEPIATLGGASSYRSAGPANTVVIDPSGTTLFTISAASNVLSVEPEILGLSTRSPWAPEAATVDGIRANLPNYAPRSGLRMERGIDGLELLIDVRSAPAPADGDLAYSFLLLPSHGLEPYADGRPVPYDRPLPYRTEGPLEFRDARGVTIFSISPSVALIERSVPRSSSPHELFEEGPAEKVDTGPNFETTTFRTPLDSAVERVEGGVRLSILLPTDLLRDPTVLFPVTIDPSFTSPVTGNAYCQDETLVFASDLLITSTGSVAMTDCTLKMDSVSGNAYDVTVQAGGQLALLRSTLKPDDAGTKFDLLVQGTLSARESTVDGTLAGIRSNGGTLSLIDVDLTGSGGPGIDASGGLASSTDLRITSPMGRGVTAIDAQVELGDLTVTGATSDGVYLRETTGNVTEARILNSGLNGFKLVDSHVNVRDTLVEGSGRNGILIVGGAPAVERSEIRLNAWTGVVFVDDHQAYLGNSSIHHNTLSGVQAALNSEADIFQNKIFGHTNFGILVDRANPTIQRNTISSNGVGIQLEDAHKPGQPGPGSDIDTNFPGNRAGAPLEAVETSSNGRMPLVQFPIDIIPLGPSQKMVAPGEQVAYSFRVVNTQSVPDVAVLSIDSDENNWATLAPLVHNLAPGAFVDVTLFIAVPASASTCTVYDVKVWANGTFQPFDFELTFSDIRSRTEITIDDIEATDGDVVDLHAHLTASGVAIANQPVTVSVGGVPAGGGLTDAFGDFHALVAQYYPLATKTLAATFPGTCHLMPAGDSATLTFTSVPTSLGPANQESHYSDHSYLTVYLTTTNGLRPLPNRIVTFTLDGAPLSPAVTNADGMARAYFLNDLAPGSYNWAAAFDASAPLEDVSVAGTFTSLKEVTAISMADLSVAVGSTPTYLATLVDDEGNPLDALSVLFYRSSAYLGADDTDGSGVASFVDTGAASQPGGTYPLWIRFASDQYYEGADAFPVLTLVKHSTTVQLVSHSGRYSDAIPMTARLVDVGGAPLAAKTISFTIDGGAPLVDDTDAQGWSQVTLPPGILPGSYALVATFAGDGTFATASSAASLLVDREVSVIDGPILVRCTVSQVLPVTVRLMEDDGPALATKPMTALRNGAIVATGATNSQGYWTFNLDCRGLPALAYSLQFVFSGDAQVIGSSLFGRSVVEAPVDIFGNVLHGNGHGVISIDSGSVLSFNEITGGSVGIEVTEGDLVVLNSLVDGTSTNDLVIGDGAEAFLTDTTFSRSKASISASANGLTVRWSLSAHVRNPATGLPQGGADMTLYASSNVVVFNAETDAGGILVSQVVTEYFEDGSGRTEYGPHRLEFDAIVGSALYLYVDHTMSLQLFYSPDTDKDGLPDSFESTAGLIWIEAEAHAAAGASVLTDPSSNGDKAVAAGSSATLTDRESFPVVEAGEWRLMIRAASTLATGDLNLEVSIAPGTSLLSVDFPIGGEYAWYLTQIISLSSANSLRIELSDGAASPGSTGLHVDRLALVRELDGTGARIRMPGQSTDALVPDADADDGADGFEVRAHNQWLEGEWFVDDWSSPSQSLQLIPRTDASGGRTVVHPTGASATSQIIAFSEDFVDGPGDYELIARVFNTDADLAATATVAYNYGPQPGNEPPLSFSRVFSLGLGYTTLRVPFNFRDSLNAGFSLAIVDSTDTSQTLNDPSVEVDKIGIVRTLKQLGPLVDHQISPGWGSPLAQFTPSFARDDGDPNGFLYVATDQGYLLKIPVSTVMQGGLPAPFDDVLTGAATSEPLLTTSNGVPLVVVGVTNAGGLGGLTAVDRRTMEIVSQLPLGLNDLPNSIASADGVLYFTTQSGTAMAVAFDEENEFSIVWARSPQLGQSHGAVAVRSPHVYFPFDQGLAVYSTDASITQPLWTQSTFADPITACPIGDITICLGPPFGPLPSGPIQGAIYGSPVVEMGHAYFVVQSSGPGVERFILYHYTEAGAVEWARDLNWSAAPATRFSPHLLIKDNMIIAAGTTVEAIDKLTGGRVWAHDLGINIWGPQRAWAPVLVDEFLAYPAGDKLYAFDANGMLPSDRDSGSNFQSDTAFTFGSPRGEDKLWQATLLPGDDFAQPLFGDFDIDGYLDILMLHGANLAVFGELVPHYRGFVPWAAYGLDPARGGVADFVARYYPTDPLGADFDYDGIYDTAEIVQWAGYTLVEAEDAVSWHAWNHAVPWPVPTNPIPGPSMQNFNFFHQFGVTLTSGYTLEVAPQLDYSSIQLPFDADKTGRYSFAIRSAAADGGAPGQILDLRVRTAAVQTNPILAKPNEEDVGYGGEGGGITGRGRDTARSDVSVSSSPDPDAMLEAAKEVVRRAIYVRMGYSAGPTTPVLFPVESEIDVDIQRMSRDPVTGTGLCLFVGIDLRFEADLSGDMDYVFELGLDLNRVPTSIRESSDLPDRVDMVRIEDLDKFRVDRRGMNPYAADDDADGVEDGEELGRHWFPLSADPDRDGLNDKTEFESNPQTNAGDRDTDHDGLRDRVEVGGQQADDNSGTPYDTEPSRGSFMESIARNYRGDPFFTPTEDLSRIPNWDGDNSAIRTDPTDPDSDDDGLPDGWRDGWIYDDAGAKGARRSFATSAFYRQVAHPVLYNVSYWHQSKIYDNFPQIWEGEDLDLDGVVNNGGLWGFYVNAGRANQGDDKSTRSDFVRKGLRETDPMKADTDDDHVAEGYEVWYATRAPIIQTGGQIKPDPTTADFGATSDYDLKVKPLPSYSAIQTGSTIAVRSERDMMAQAVDLGATADLSIREVTLELLAGDEMTIATVELWVANGACGPNIAPSVQLAGAEVTSPVNNAGSTSFVFRSPVRLQWDGTPTSPTNCLFVIVRSYGTEVTWKAAPGAAETWTKDGYETASWSSLSGKGQGAVTLYPEVTSSQGDGATLLQEFIAGTNPKVANSDLPSAGLYWGVSDSMIDGLEMTGDDGPGQGDVGRVVFRTNADEGAYWTGNYNANSWVYYDTTPGTSGADGWAWYHNAILVENPDETFEGTNELTTKLFDFLDGGSVRRNAAAGKVFVVLPGSDFANLRETRDVLDVDYYYAGRAWVLTDTQTLGDSFYQTDSANDVIRNPGDPLADQYKQLFVSSPFSWDTDRDGVADGSEQSPTADSEPGTSKDTLNNARDMDSDGDGLTDGDEILKACPSWNLIYSFTSATIPLECRDLLDPNGDGVVPSRQTDSDSDSVPDGKEPDPFGNADPNSDSLLNFLDPDADSDRYCDGYCPGPYGSAFNIVLPSSEDVNGNGGVDDGETNPRLWDTDNDNLGDGPDLADGRKGEKLQSPRLIVPGTSVYQVAPTNSLVFDTDEDGLGDGAELVVETIGYTKGVVGYAGYFVGTRQSATDPSLPNTDNDGLIDGLERLSLRTSGFHADTDDDGITDGNEDHDHNGIIADNEPNPLHSDIDQDFLSDLEEVGVLGVRESDEPNPRVGDTDGDGVLDGHERALQVTAGGGAWTITHDYDQDGLSDLLDPDSDKDGLTDGEENWVRTNGLRDGTYDSATELNIFDPDTDDDGLWDGAEPAWRIDLKDETNDNLINGQDSDSNGDGTNDDLQVLVLFRTNALGGSYGQAGAWIAFDYTVNSFYANQRPDLAWETAGYTYEGPVSQPSGTKVITYFGPNDDPENLELTELETPEGYAVYRDASTGFAYIQRGDGTTWEFRHSQTEGSLYTAATKPARDFVARAQEIYDSNLAVGADTDRDGIPNVAEDINGDGLFAGTEPDPLDRDSDDDGIFDGREGLGEWWANRDGMGGINARDQDADNDGLRDDSEDRNRDGRLDLTTGETDPLNPDTDGDGIQDGTELSVGYSEHLADSNVLGEGCTASSTILCFKPDQDDFFTDPLDPDFDDDGLYDGAEDLDAYGSYNPPTAAVPGPDLSNPRSFDSDGDHIPDGVERGITLRPPGTDEGTFVPDRADFDGVRYSWSQTLAYYWDTDNDGLWDGVEDWGWDGARNWWKNLKGILANPPNWDFDGNGIPEVDVHLGDLYGGETSPNDWDSDDDGLCDGGGGSACGPRGEDEDLNGHVTLWPGTELPKETDPMVFDSDQDLLGDGLERTLTTEPLDNDTENDGITDGVEVVGWKVVIHREDTGALVASTTNNPNPRLVKSNPKLADTDSDGRNDFVEWQLLSDPTSLDTDGDHLPDAWEIIDCGVHLSQTDPDFSHRRAYDKCKRDNARVNTIEGGIPTLQSFGVTITKRTHTEYMFITVIDSADFQFVITAVDNLLMESITFNMMGVFNTYVGMNYMWDLRGISAVCTPSTAAIGFTLSGSEYPSMRFYYVGLRDHNGNSRLIVYSDSDADGFLGLSDVPPALEIDAASDGTIRTPRLDALRSAAEFLFKMILAIAWMVFGDSITRAANYIQALCETCPVRSDSDSRSAVRALLRGKQDIKDKIILAEAIEGAAQFLAAIASVGTSIAELKLAEPGLKVTLRLVLREFFFTLLPIDPRDPFDMNALDVANLVTDTYDATVASPGASRNSYLDPRIFPNGELVDQPQFVAASAMMGNKPILTLLDHYDVTADGMMADYRFDGKELGYFADDAPGENAEAVAFMLVGAFLYVFGHALIELELGDDADEKTLQASEVVVDYLAIAFMVSGYIELIDEDGSDWIGAIIQGLQFFFVTFVAAIEDTMLIVIPGMIIPALVGTTTTDGKYEESDEWWYYEPCNS